MAKIVDGIKMDAVKADEIKAKIKEFNAADLGVTCKVGTNPLGSAKAFVKAMEAVEVELPAELAEYYNSIVVGDEDPDAAPPAEEDEPEAEAEETPPAASNPPKQKTSAKPKAAKPTPSKAAPKAAEKPPKKAKEPKAPKADKGPSNKMQVYKQWKKTREKATAADLETFIESRVKLTTIRSWLNQWKHGNNFPGGVSAE